ncbi:hypothetical protein Q4603_00220 [Zobellia galactanivorans]|uniref:Conserved hypothetical membrane protein n=1 Tax=Zobellia galactanivorans (strain DSM 12802 / CCUG 47099 / CIP 106680 / NCIMB 13871 / Dsij) TaxID=63186 RepID=G0L671_ZOBGA|nr:MULTISPECIES: hypothetical protein [Zobellia]MDO6807006.1 hypothetical protein [Zobellia galactanivorans]CAZ96753.1 Conserved hypothetical membrane protein [Zobellia galactanivorans]
MISQNLPLVNYGNGIIMIAVFAIVCLALVVTVVLFMNSGKKK